MKSVVFWTFNHLSYALLIHCKISTPSLQWIQTTEYKSQNDFLSFYSSKSCHLSEYTLKLFGGLFDTRSEIFPPEYTLKLFGGLFVTRSEIFPPFKQGWSLEFLCSPLRRFYSVFLFQFLKWNSTLCQICWITDLESLKLFLFYADEYLEAKICRFTAFFTRWQCLLNRGTSFLPTCENALVELF